MNRKKRILELLEKAKVSPEDYMRSLRYNHKGYTYYLKRDIDELYINSYNKEWLRAWNGNLDIQVCMDFFQIITYITEYFLKDFDEELNSNCNNLQDILGRMRDILSEIESVDTRFNYVDYMLRICCGIIG